MARHRRPPSQGGTTFLRNHADGIASIDLFVVPTLAFRLLYGLILRHDWRQILWLAVTADPTVECIARSTHASISFAIVIGPMVKSLLDAFALWAYVTGQRRRDSPWQNGHAERLIGSIRREYLDHVIVFGKRHLRHL